MTRRRHEPELATLPVARRRLYALIVGLFPIALLLAGELLARLFMPEPPALFHEQTINGVVYRSINPKVTGRYFPTLAVQPGTGTDLFRAEKLPGTIRIFALGASSTLGYPYMVNGSFPAMLRDRLRHRYPDRTVEVVNLGVTAVTLHTVLDFARWCLKEKPDALIVYEGHNEFYGALGVGSSQFVGSARWMVRAYLALHESRLFLAIKSVVMSLASSATRNADDRPGTLMKLMARETAIPLGSSTYERGLTTFRDNIEAVVEASQDAGVPVILCTLVSNLRDLPPLESIEPDPWTDEQRGRMPSALSEIDSLIRTGDLVRAASVLDAWTPAESTHAGLAFQHGHLARSRGDMKSAAGWYRRARDLDGIRFRAPSAFNDVVRSFAGANGVLVADVESVMTHRTPDGIIGSEFLLEHVHPNLTGYRVIADAVEPSVVAALAHRGFPTPKEPPLHLPPLVTRVDSLVAAFRITILVNSWPFTDSSVTLADMKAGDEEGELALSYLRQDLTWEALHVRAAERYEHNGQLAEAAAEYRALIAATPYNVSPYLRLGVVLQRQSDLDGAVVAFRRSLEVERTTTALLKLGEIAYELGRHAEAVQYLTQALSTGQLERGRVPEIRLAIAVATMRGGDPDRALTLARSLVDQYPDFERGRAFLAFLEQEAPTGARR